MSRKKLPESRRSIISPHYSKPPRAWRERIDKSVINGFARLNPSR